MAQFLKYQTCDKLPGSYIQIVQSIMKAMSCYSVSLSAPAVTGSCRTCRLCNKLAAFMHIVKENLVNFEIKRTVKKNCVHFLNLYSIKWHSSNITYSQCQNTVPIFWYLVCTLLKLFSTIVIILADLFKVLRIFKYPLRSIHM